MSRKRTGTLLALRGFSLDTLRGNHTVFPYPRAQANRLEKRLPCEELSKLSTRSQLLTGYCEAILVGLRRGESNFSF